MITICSMSNSGLKLTQRAKSQPTLIAQLCGAKPKFGVSATIVNLSNSAYCNHAAIIKQGHSNFADVFLVVAAFSANIKRLG